MSITPFDPVHTVQSAFRKFLSSWAFPGRIFDMCAESQTLPEDLGLQPILVLAGRVLLDTETTFCVRGAGAEQAQNQLSRLCYAPAKPASEAMFLFCTEAGPALDGLFLEARVGTLENPHEGATVLAMVPDLETGLVCRWEGPGLASPRVQTLPLTFAQWEVRNRVNQEFPLGFDLMFFDARQRVMTLPRTTRLTPLEETSWPM